MSEPECPKRLTCPCCGQEARHPRKRKPKPKQAAPVELPGQMPLPSMPDDEQPT